MDLDTRRLILPERFSGGRRSFTDALTFDSQSYHSLDNRGNQRGLALEHRHTFADVKVRDSNGNIRVWKRGTYDSTGAFLVGELERLDQELNEPLVDIEYGRDVDLSQDVTIADEVSSFTNSTFASQGGLGTGNGIGSGKSWVGKNSNEVARSQLDISKTPHSLYLWAEEMSYTIPELESAAKLGRPIDQQKFEGLQLKHQMDIDEMVYIGDTGYGVGGLVNYPGVAYANLAAGASGFTTWANKSPDEILADFNTAITTTWQNSAWAVMPRRVGLPPFQFGLISTMKVSLAGSESVLDYVLKNNVTTKQQGAKLEIVPMKWLIGAGYGGTIGTPNTVDRMIVYTKDYKRLRYPMTLLARTPVEFRSLYHLTTYFCRLGVLEIPYPETVSYWDGL